MPRPRVPPWNLDAELASDLGSRGELQPLVDLIGRFAIFVDPAVAKAVAAVYPKTARVTTGSLRQGQVRNGIRYWTNQPAEAAFFAALGVNPELYTGHVVCHVYPGSPSSPRHFTALANLFIVPTSLASFTEWAPVLAALQWRAYQLYGYRGPARAAPKRPPLLPKRWRAPATLERRALAWVIDRLKEARRERPMYIQPRQAMVAMPTAFPEDEDWPWWRATRETSTVQPTMKGAGAGVVDLEQQFWRDLNDHPKLLHLLTSWVVRHAYFAPPAVVAAVPNPFPKTRRFRPSRGEREGQVIGGVTMCVNKPARNALIVAVGRSIPRTRGGLVDHLWADAVFLPAHFAHLGGLVIVPRALGSVVDAEPVRAMLQRHAFERTGYAGPTGLEPPRPKGMPRPWPENVTMSPQKLARAIEKLERYRREIPGFYKRWRPGGPGRAPGKQKV